MRVQHVIFAAANAGLQNLDASHQAQFPAELMRVERAFCLASVLAYMPDARRDGSARHTSRDAGSDWSVTGTAKIGPPAVPEPTGVLLFAPVALSLMLRDWKIRRRSRLVDR
jgi:hypothetical protein